MGAATGSPPAGSSRAHGAAPAPASEHSQERPGVEIVLKRVAERLCSADVVVVPPTRPGARQVAALDEIVDDCLHTSLRDSDLTGDVSQPDVGIARDADQHLRVMREERPGPCHAGHKIPEARFWCRRYIPRYTRRGMDPSNE